MPRTPTHRPPTPPGEVLLHDFFELLGLTQALDPYEARQREGKAFASIELVI